MFNIVKIDPNTWDGGLLGWERVKPNFGNVILPSDTHVDGIEIISVPRTFYNVPWFDLKNPDIVMWELQTKWSRYRKNRQWVNYDGRSSICYSYNQLSDQMPINIQNEWEALYDYMPLPDSRVSNYFQPTWAGGLKSSMVVNYTNPHPYTTSIYIDFNANFSKTSYISSSNYFSMGKIRPDPSNITPVFIKKDIPAHGIYNETIHFEFFSVHMSNPRLGTSVPYNGFLQTHLQPTFLIEAKEWSSPGNKMTGPFTPRSQAEMDQIINNISISFTPWILTQRVALLWYDNTPENNDDDIVYPAIDG